MQFMNLPREVWVLWEGTWRKVLGLSMEGMALVEMESEQKILHHKLILREDMLWPQR